MGKKQVNAQGEAQLLAEWIDSLGAGVKSKTHVNVGAQALKYGGVPLSPAQSRAFGVWNDWADARIATAREVWIVEAKLVATDAAYGQVLGYSWEYPSSLDYRQFAPMPVIPVVLAAGVRTVSAGKWQAMGIRTIFFAPSFPFSSALAKLFRGAQTLLSGESG